MFNFDPYQSLQTLGSANPYTPETSVYDQTALLLPLYWLHPIRSFPASLNFGNKFPRPQLDYN